MNETNAKIAEIDPIISDSQGPSRSILIESGKSSRSKSDSNIKQKRISWGPSKVLEFFPSEKLRDLELDYTMNDDSASKKTSSQG